MWMYESRNSHSIDVEEKNGELASWLRQKCMNVVPQIKELQNASIHMQSSLRILSRDKLLGFKPKSELAFALDDK